MQNGFLYLLLRHNFKKFGNVAIFLLFPRINFREFVLAKYFAGINFSEIAQKSLNSRKLLLLRYLHVVFVHSKTSLRAHCVHARDRVRMRSPAGLLFMF